MPDFEPAAPIGQLSNAYYQQAQIAARLRQQQLAAAAANQSGGGRDGGYYDDGSNIQSAIFGRDQLQFQQARANQEFGGVPQSQIFAAQAQQRQMESHFALEAELSQTQLTQQEQMRLARMKNAIGDIQNDPTLSAEEKGDFTMQLKTGINPMERRQAQAKMAADIAQKNAIVQNTDLQAAMRKRELDVMSMDAEKRHIFQPDPQALSAITDDLMRVHPQLALVPGGQQVVATLAKQEAIRQGLGVHGFLQPDGKIEIDHHLNPDGTPIGGGSRSSSGGKGGGSDHPLGISQDQYMSLHKEAMDAAAKEQAATTTDSQTGVKSNVNPQTQAWKIQRTKEIMQEKLDALKAYNDQATPKAGRGYDPSRAPWNAGKAQAAAAATPAGQVIPKEDQAAVAARDKSFNEQANQVLSREDIPQGIRTQAAEKIGVIRRALAAAGGNPANIQGAAKQEFDAAVAFLDQNVPKQSPQKSESPRGETPEEQHRRMATTAPESHTGDRRVATPAEAIGNAARSFWDNAVVGGYEGIKAASPFRKRRAGDR